MIPAIDIVNQPLPSLPYDITPSGYRTTKPSSQSTANTDPPKVFYLFGEELLRCYNSSLLQTVLNDTSLEPITIECGHYLRTEGDVERASTLYLLHPVNLIIEKVLEAKNALPYKCLSQHTEGNSRTDVLWTLISDLLKMENKNTQMIRKADWETIVANNKADAQQLIMEQYDSQGSMLEANAEPISRQAAKYGLQETSLGVVAVFDWHHLVILDFKPVGDSEGTRYHFCEEDNAWTFRKLLLAVFIYCCRKGGIIGQDGKQILSKAPPI
ncbi:hypothetical protein F5146DRAFT_1119881 [Armillaria mellea]|nr:hypothetical protein F5146DRAFT_1119881 [Armillaria mellea]